MNHGQIGVLLSMTLVAMLAGSSAAAEAGAKAVTKSDREYVEKNWKFYFPYKKPGAKEPVLDAELLRRVASVPKPGVLQTKACMLLAKIKKPPQLGFLVELAQRPTSKPILGGIVQCLEWLVKTPEDQDRIKVLLGNEALFPRLLLLVSQTNDQEIIKQALAVENAKRYNIGQSVVYFLQARQATQGQADRDVAEPFMRAWMSRPLIPGERRWTESVLAAELGYSWAAELLVGIIMTPQGLAEDDKLSREENHNRRLIIRQQTKTKCRAVIALQKLVKQDFGADPKKKPDDYLRSATAKVKAWWAKNKHKPEYHLKTAKKLPDKKTEGKEESKAEKF